MTRGQVDEGKEDGKVILPAADPNPHPTLFHVLVGPSEKKKASIRKIKQAGGKVGYCVLVIGPLFPGATDSLPSGTCWRLSHPG